MQLFCVAINDVLLNFCRDQSHADLWIRVRGAIEFLSYYPERKRKLVKFSDLPTYGFRGEKRSLTYEQLVVTQRYLIEHKTILLETKKKLPIVLNIQIDVEKRREAARYCLELFSGLFTRYQWHFIHPSNFGIPVEILDWISKSKVSKKESIEK